MNRILTKYFFRNSVHRGFQQTGRRCFGGYTQTIQGLTLVEVMIVIVIIGILSSIAIPNYFSTKEKARLAATIGEIRILEKKIIGYNIDHESYPETIDDTGMKSLKDPWGNSYQYLKIEGRTNPGVGQMRKDHHMVPVNSDFDLYSNGKDGKSQTPFTAKASRDDIVRANNGRYIGLVSDY